MLYQTPLTLVSQGCHNWKRDKSTPAVFGKYIDVYDIKQAVDDGATVL